MRTLLTPLAALAIAATSVPVHAQHTGHDHHAIPVKPAPKKPPPKQAAPAPAPAPKRPPARPAAKAAAKASAPPARPAPPPRPQATTPAPAKAPAPVDHAAMGHAAPAAVDHAAMGHGDHSGMDHGAMDHAAMGHAPPASMSGGTGAGGHAGMAHGAMDHAGHAPAAGDGEVPSHAEHSAIDHAAMGHGPRGDLRADAAPRTPIPVLTDADRAAAFPPDLHGHTTHDTRIHSFWLADRLEWQDADGGTLGWEGVAWIGGDIHRLWLRSEGAVADGEIGHGDLEVLYGRSITPWWDLVAGVRQDFGHGPSRTWAAIGLQGMAPYKFEVEATAYVGSGGRTAATLEAEYDTLLTNRLILQWQAEASVHGKDDPALGIASGLSTVEAGARLRYEITRRFAPYVGVQVERAFGGTADLRRAEGEPKRDTRLVAGLRFWF
jgi:copper resistance protein B